MYSAAKGSGSPSTSDTGQHYRLGIVRRNGFYGPTNAVLPRAMPIFWL
jgi:hypothetical protein